MVYNQALAVGLAVGLPSALILSVCVFLWLRNQRKQKQEDAFDDVDMDMRDNHLFGQFQEELHKPYNDPNKSLTTQQSSEAVEKEHVSLSNGSSSTSAEEKKRLQLPPAIHQKTPSSYDFYDTFIPVLPSSQSDTQDTLDLSQPPGIGEAGGNRTPMSSNSSNASIIGGGAINREKSLDNFAKQLHGPGFFEKLPSRATSAGLKHRNIHTTYNNSSSDILQGTNIQPDAINDSYVYLVDDKLPDPTLTSTPDRLSKASNTIKGLASGPGIENNYEQNIATDSKSPFGPEHMDEQPDVIFK